MILSFAKELPPSATVEVAGLQSKTADNEEALDESCMPISATRVNPYTYTFNAPSG